MHDQKKDGPGPHAPQERPGVLSGTPEGEPEKPRPGIVPGTPAEAREEQVPPRPAR